MLIVPLPFLRRSDPNFTVAGPCTLVAQSIYLLLLGIETISMTVLAKGAIR